MCNLNPVTEDPLKDITVVDEQLVSEFKPTCSKTFNIQMIYLIQNLKYDLTYNFIPVKSSKNICELVVVIHFLQFHYQQVQFLYVRPGLHILWLNSLLPL